MVAAAGVAGLRDPAVLAQAAGDGRVVVTHDQKTMPSHFAAFIATAPSPGVLIIPQRLPIAIAVEDVLLIWSTMDAEEWRNTTGFCPSELGVLITTCSRSSVVQFFTTREQEWKSFFAPSAIEPTLLQQRCTTASTVD